MKFEVNSLHESAVKDWWFTHAHKENFAGDILYNCWPVNGDLNWKILKFYLHKSTESFDVVGRKEFDPAENLNIVGETAFSILTFSVIDED